VDARPRAQLYEAFGAYVRSQRQLAQLTLRQAAELARISNPYLSQIEHGLTLPSVTVISALADALEVSADTLLLGATVRAGAPDGAAVPALAVSTLVAVLVVYSAPLLGWLVEPLRQRSREPRRVRQTPQHAEARTAEAA